MPDGRLCLLDYGQMKRIPRDVRLQVAELTLALADDRRADVVRIMTALGVRTRRMDADVIYRLTAFWFDRDTHDVTGGENISNFLDEMERVRASICGAR